MAVSGRAAIGVVVAMAVVLATLAVRPPPAGAAPCPNPQRIDVPGAVQQDQACLADLTVAGGNPRTNRDDWEGLNAEGTRNPTGIPGLQVDGYFPDSSQTNCNNAQRFGGCHDSQFVLRLPHNWNGKLVISGAPGVRRQYANDFIISDFVLARGYAFAATDKGNTGVNFFDDGSAPGGSVLEWHRRVRELTLAAKAAVGQRYGRAPGRTYITGISNGGYLTRYALENSPELYDGGVDWEGTLFREQGPNLLTFLPPTLRNYPEYEATGSDTARDNIIRAGFEPGSEFLWDEHYTIYWDLTQRVYREEFDPGYDGALKAGIPFCQPGTPNCDADYRYFERPQAVRDAMRRVSLTGRIGKPLLTLHGNLDTLLPIDVDSTVYRQLIVGAGKGRQHRYYQIGRGNHVDSFYDDNRNRLRPILPCHRDAFRSLEAWVEDGQAPPPNQFVPKPARGDVVNSCQLS